MIKIAIIVLRLGHRKRRDMRISSHCGLVARALGAHKVAYSGEKDERVIKTANDITAKWGGDFKAFYVKNWKNWIRKRKNEEFTICHLTMYGLPIQDIIGKIRKKKNIVVIIGAEKVPPDAYKLSDFNISVTNQPHSEIAALSIFLHEYFKGKELKRKFENAKLKVVPSKAGKEVIYL